jgi:hypothetical protein
MHTTGCVYRIFGLLRGAYTYFRSVEPGQCDDLAARESSEVGDQYLSILLHKLTGV